MKGSVHRLARRLFAVLWCLVATSATAATTNVYWNFGFSPATVAIHSGDTIVWHHADPNEFPVQITSDTPGFSFILFDFGDTYGITFEGTGTIGYHDSYGNNGTIIVNSAPPLPPPVPAVLSAPRLVGTNFLFDATSLTQNRTTVLEVSTNLATWTPVQTNTPGGTSLTYTNPVSFPAQFFRIKQIHFE